VTVRRRAVWPSRLSTAAAASVETAAAKVARDDLPSIAPAGSKHPPARLDRKQPHQARLPPPPQHAIGPVQTVGMRPGLDESRAVPAPARPKVKVITVAPNPLYSEVWLDGTRVLKVDVGKTTFEVPWDREHLVEVRNDACCEPMPFRLGPESPKIDGDRLIARLVRKPAKLRVVLIPPPLTPAQMDYVVFPERPGATHTPFTQGEELWISFDATGEAGEPVPGKSLLVSVYLDGKKLPLRQRVDLKPGENKSLEIRLPE